MQVSTILRVLLASAVAINTVSAAPCVSVQVQGQAAIVDGTVATLTIKLNEECRAYPPSEVQITAPGLTCTRQAFTFNPKDPSIFNQEVECRTDTGAAPTQNGAVVDLPVTCTYKGGKVGSDTQNIKRKIVSTGSCTGVGDPHLVTFDGVKYDFQAPGVFRLFESNNLLVQVFQEKCGPVSNGDGAPSCYQGVSVAFGASVAKLFIQQGKIALGKGTDEFGWFSVEKLNGADGYRVFSTADPFTYVDVNLQTWAAYKNYPYLNIALQISPYFKSINVAGLMGNWNGNAGDDVTNTAALVNAHDASLTNNLFTCTGDACARLTKPGTSKDAVAKSIPCKAALAHQAYTVVDAKDIPVKAFTPTLHTYKLRQLRTNPNPKNLPVNLNLTRRANELCRRIAKTFEVCAKYVPDANNYQDTVCIADAVTLQDLSVIDNAKISYLRACRRAIDDLLQSKTLFENETAKVKKDRDSLDFGVLTKCHNQCSQRGQCLAVGCKCNDGYTGQGCVDTI